MEPFAGIGHDDLLKLLVSVAVLLTAARLLGELMKRFGQPAILGELLAGVIVGPAFLAGFFPWLERWVVPTTQVQANLLDVVALLGVLFLILVIGMETDLALIRQHARAALSIGIMGFLVPAALGFAVAGWFPASLLGVNGTPTVFALFLAVALALSAIPVLAKILSDLRLFRSGFGQVVLAAGMFDDLIGWTALGLVTSLATAGRVGLEDVFLTLGAVVLFFAASYWVARPAARLGLQFLQDTMRARDGLLGFVVGFALILAAFSHVLHLEPVLGAFVAGMILSRQRRLPPTVSHQLEAMTMHVFAPIFLAVAGLRLDASIFLETELLVLTLLLILVASVGKLLGAFVGARWLSGYGMRHSLAFGTALNARGVLGIIVAVIGQSIGIFGSEVYAMIVVTSLATSLMAPIGLKALLGREIPEERDGGKHEKYKRVLIPVRMRPNLERRLDSSEVSVLGRVVAAPPTVTLMTVVEEHSTREGAEFIASVRAGLPREWDASRRVSSGDPGSAILNELGNGYDLVVLGASGHQERDDQLFDPVVDSVVRLAPCDSMIFAPGQGSWPPEKILVPTGGSSAAEHAARLAFTIADELTEVVLFHVLDPDLVLVPQTRSNSLRLAMDIAQALLIDLRRLGEQSGVRVTTETMTGPRVVDAIVERAAHEVDLTIVGTNVRLGSPRLYLGPKVERLTREIPSNTIILNAATSRRANVPT